MTHAEKAALSYYQQMDKACPTVAQYSRNLNLLYLNGSLDGCYNREDIITQIQKILMRKTKANVLLSGVAGCGKTALVEGTAAKLTIRKIDYEHTCNREKAEYRESLRVNMRPDGAYADYDDESDFLAPPKPPLCDCVIYDLSLTSLIGGTRYRGDFEERLQKIMDECSAHPDVVLFIDEVPQLTTLGRNDANDSPAQALKPALARKELRLIGAPTTEEKACIAKDKALWRRFCEIVVPPLCGEAAVKAAERIFDDYCRFHAIVTDVSAS